MLTFLAFVFGGVYFLGLLAFTALMIGSGGAGFWEGMWWTVLWPISLPIGMFQDWRKYR